MQIAQATEFENHSGHRRHICIVTETFPPEVNGVALTLARLIEGLRLQGHRVSLVRPRQHRRDCADLNYDPRLTLVSSLPLPGYKGLRIGLPAGETLKRRWTQHRPEVVYIATEGPLGWSAKRAAQCLAIPVFSGFHTNFHSYSKHYHAGWLRFVILAYLRRFHRRTAGTIVASSELGEQLRAMGLTNVNVLGRGVDSRLFTLERRSRALRRMWRAGPNDLVVLYVGRIAAEKNVRLAVEAYRAMQRVNSAIRFVIVGDGPLRSALQKKHPDLIFCGVQMGEDLAKRYASADVFLFPSETETFGNVTLEAMASGLAVIAYDYAAARLHIAHGRSGVLVPYGQSQAFIESAAQLVSQPQDLVEMRRDARRHATSLDWQRVVNRFAALLTGEVNQDPVTAIGDAVDVLRPGLSVGEI